MARFAHRPAILLTEGSSLSARQTLYALGPLRYRIDFCDPKPDFALGHFSRFIRRGYRCPSFTRDPEGYVQFLEDRIQTGHYDVVLPVHDQVFLLSRVRDRFKGIVGLPAPAFESMVQLQSKAAFVRVLEKLKLPAPPTAIVRTRRELDQAAQFPFYLKLAHSTAGCGVWLVRDRQELNGLADTLQQTGILDNGHEILVQEPAEGNLRVVQSVFQHGRLVAGHCYQALALGVGGSARARESVSQPQVLEDLAALGSHLNWHGALSVDYICSPDGRPAYIDANPRIGETMNATLSGVNLCELLVQVGLGKVAQSPPPSRPGVRTHSVLMSLMAIGQRGESRRQLLAELWRAWNHEGVYRNSQDEITRPASDPLSFLPAAFLTTRLLINPRVARRIVTNTVDNYSLTDHAVRTIVALGSQEDRKKKAEGSELRPPPADPRISRRIFAAPGRYPW